MTKLMDKLDWMQTVANVGTAENVWWEDFSTDGDTIAVPVPECGRYQVILVKIGNEAPIPRANRTSLPKKHDEKGGDIDRRARMFGALKEKIKFVAKDFDGPLDDFAEYM